MQIVQASSAGDSPNVHGVRSQILLNTDEVQVVLISIKPGEGMKMHTTPVDAFFYGIEGTGIVEVGDERGELGVDTLVNSPKGIPHRLANEGDGLFRFLVVKTPHPSRAAS
ncbi:MAG: cupin domain-containing protein [Anaerolineae bacterium]